MGLDREKYCLLVDIIDEYSAFLWRVSVFKKGMLYILSIFTSGFAGVIYS